MDRFEIDQVLEIAERPANSLRRHLDSCLGIHGDPCIGQELAELVGGMSRQSFQNVFEGGNALPAFLGPRMIRATLQS
jgi:hypothetical protein